MRREQFNRYFIPSERNNYHPHILQSISVAVMFLLILLSFSIANLQALLWTSSDWLVGTVLPAVIVDLTNDERSEYTEGILRRNSVLDEAARLKAEDMAAGEYFAHWSPDGLSPWHWFDEAGYTFVHAGENLAVHFTDSEDVVAAWMDSPSHRANILNNNYTEIGVGTAKGIYQGYATVFVVQLFGTPAAYASSDTELVGGEDDEVPIDDVTSMRIETDTDVVVVSSDLATTVRDGVPLGVTDETAPPSSHTNALERAATQPDLWLQVLYLALALFVIIALFFSIVIEWRRQRPIQIVYGAGLLGFMAFLFYAHMIVTSGVSIA